MESEQQSLENIICTKQMRSLLPTTTTTSTAVESNALATSAYLSNNRRAIVQASLSTVFDKQKRHLSGTLCLAGDTMEGIVQLLVFLKAFSVSFLQFLLLTYRKKRR